MDKNTETIIKSQLMALVENIYANEELKSESKSEFVKKLLYSVSMMDNECHNNIDLKMDMREFVQSLIPVNKKVYILALGLFTHNETVGDFIKMSNMELKAKGPLCYEVFKSMKDDLLYNRIYNIDGKLYRA